MSTVKISELSELTNPLDVSAADVLQIINTDQTSPSFPTGTNRKIKASTLANGLATLTTTIPQVIQDALDSKASLEDFNTIGLKIAQPVVTASTGNWSLAALVPGASVDGVTLVSGNRVLLKDQSTQSANGVYVVQSSGPATRATDFDTLLEINDGYVLVNGGSTWKGSGWVVTTTVEEIDVDPIVFTQFSTALTSVTKAMVGLGNVDNTSDAAKPISTATATALAGKQATITGAATTITSSNLTASRVLVSGTDGKVAVSTLGSDKLAHLSDVTSAIGAQLALKANLANPTFSGSINVLDTNATNNFAIGVKTNGVNNDSGIWTDNNNNISFDARSGSGNLNVSIRSSGDSFLAGGNLGIGTASPSSILHTYASQEVAKLESSTNQAYVKIQTSEGDSNRVEIANRTGGRMALYNPTSGDVVNILKNGNVGIGKDNPSTRLDVNGTVTATAFSGTLTGNVTGNVTGSSGSCTGNSATATLANNGARAWVNFNAAGNIRSSSNVSSVTDRAGYGYWTVNLSTPLGDANGAVVCGGSEDDANIGDHNQWTSAYLSSDSTIEVIIETAGSNRADSKYISVAVFR